MAGMIDFDELERDMNALDAEPDVLGDFDPARGQTQGRPAPPPPMRSSPPPQLVMDMGDIPEGMPPGTIEQLRAAAAAPRVRVGTPEAAARFLAAVEPPCAPAARPKLEPSRRPIPSSQESLVAVMEKRLMAADRNMLQFCSRDDDLDAGTFEPAPDPNHEAAGGPPPPPTG